MPCTEVGRAHDSKGLKLLEHLLAAPFLHPHQPVHTIRLGFTPSGPIAFHTRNVHGPQRVGTHCTWCKLGACHLHGMASLSLGTVESIEGDHVVVIDAPGHQQDGPPRAMRVRVRVRVGVGLVVPIAAVIVIERTESQLHVERRIKEGVGRVRLHRRVPHHTHVGDKCLRHRHRHGRQGPSLWHRPLEWRRVGLHKHVSRRRVQDHPTAVQLPADATNTRVGHDKVAPERAQAAGPVHRVVDAVDTQRPAWGQRKQQQVPIVVVGCRVGRCRVKARVGMGVGAAVTWGQSAFPWECGGRNVQRRVVKVPGPGAHLQHGLTRLACHDAQGTPIFARSSDNQGHACRPVVSQHVRRRAEGVVFEHQRCGGVRARPHNPCRRAGVWIGPNVNEHRLVHGVPQKAASHQLASLGVARQHGNGTEIIIVVHRTRTKGRETLGTIGTKRVESGSRS
eukprot:m.77967 g.77967  ORF g.77967 m.77967 type:complete len:450 (-) comp9179_c0_seq2:630-1979(-)